MKEMKEGDKVNFLAQLRLFEALELTCAFVILGAFLLFQLQSARYIQAFGTWKNVTFIHIKVLLRSQRCEDLLHHWKPDSAHRCTCTNEGLQRSLPKL
jgi:hypothetical protein